MDSSVLGWRLDEIILEIFYNRNDSIVLWNVVDKEMRHFKREVFNPILWSIALFWYLAWLFSPHWWCSHFSARISLELCSVFAINTWQEYHKGSEEADLVCSWVANTGSLQVAESKEPMQTGCHSWWLCSKTGAKLQQLFVQAAEWASPCLQVNLNSLFDIQS